MVGGERMGVMSCVAVVVSKSKIGATAATMVVGDQALVSVSCSVKRGERELFGRSRLLVIDESGWLMKRKERGRHLCGAMSHRHDPLLPYKRSSV
jgi:hypothetical protein